MLNLCKTVALAFLLTATSQALAINILQVGDSHTEGHYGTFMKQFLENPGSVCDVPSQNNQVSLFAMGSSSPRHWTDANWQTRWTRNNKGETVRRNLGDWFCDRNLRQHNTGSSTREVPADNYCQPGESPMQSIYNETKPDLVVLTFSHNSTYLRNNQEAVNRYVHRMLNVMSEDTECIFITDPPIYGPNPPRDYRGNPIPQERFKAIQETFLRAVESWNAERQQLGQTTCAAIPGITAHTETQFNTNRNYTAGDRWHLTERGARFFTDDVGQRICQSYMDRFSTGGSNTGVFETEGGYVEPKGWDSGTN